MIWWTLTNWFWNCILSVYRQHEKPTCGKKSRRLFQKCREAVHYIAQMHEKQWTKLTTQILSDLVIKRMDRASVQLVTLHIIFRHMRIETNGAKTIKCKQFAKTVYSSLIAFWFSIKITNKLHVSRFTITTSKNIWQTHLEIATESQPHRCCISELE